MSTRGRGCGCPVPGVGGGQLYQWSAGRCRRWRQHRSTMSTVRQERPMDGVVQLTLDRPERLNAMNFELISDLHAALDQIAADRTCRVVVLTGAGRGFCAGLDLKGTGSAPGTEGLGRVQSGLKGQQHIARLVPHLRSLPQAVLAAVNG